MRNKEEHTFKPCSVCRTATGLTIEPEQAPEKIKNFEVREKNISTFLFIKPNQIFARSPVNISRYSHEEFIKYNIDQYHICKNDDTRIPYESEEPDVVSCHGYFIISIEWMSKWRHFVNGKGPQPGEVDNSNLKKKIQDARRKCYNPEDEQDLGL